MIRARLRACARKLLQARDDLAVAHAAAAAPHAGALHQPARGRRSASCWAGPKAGQSATNTLLWGTACACCRAALQWHHACPTTPYCGQLGKVNYKAAIPSAQLQTWSGAAYHCAPCTAYRPAISACPAISRQKHICLCEVSTACTPAWCACPANKAHKGRPRHLISDAANSGEYGGAATSSAPNTKWRTSEGSAPRAQRSAAASTAPTCALAGIQGAKQTLSSDSRLLLMVQQSLRVAPAWSKQRHNSLGCGVLLMTSAGMLDSCSWRTYICTLARP